MNNLPADHVDAVKRIKEKQRQLSRAFGHFNKRLAERYGFNVTFEEYLFLCEIECRFLKKGYKNKGENFIGVITHRNIEITVVKTRSPDNIILTALPEGEKDRILNSRKLKKKKNA